MTGSMWTKMNLRGPATSLELNWRQRKTVIDLYTERDQTRWYWRIAANISTMMIMAGFLVYPSAFAAPAHLQVDEGLTGIIAVILLAVGYTVSVTLWFICTSWLFQLEIIFLPCLWTCIFGLFNVSYNLAVRDPTAPQWTSSSISALTLATISTLIYLVLALITVRKIHMVRTQDALHRHTADVDSIHLQPEDEQQRQQLLRLLQRKDSTKKVSSEASESTFRIDLPENIRRSGTTHLAAPSNWYGGRGTNAPPLSGTGTGNGPHQWATYPTPIIITTTTPTNDLPPQLPRMDHGGESDFGVPGIVNTRYARSKAEEAGYTVEGSTPTHPHPHTPLLHERHPLERERVQYRMETDEEQDRRRRSRSRESRRAEIEMESRRTGGKGSGSPAGEMVKGEGRGGGRVGGPRGGGGGGGGRGQQRGELEGVEVVPRIVRVETDGWDRPGER